MLGLFRLGLFRLGVWLDKVRLNWVRFGLTSTFQKYGDALMSRTHKRRGRTNVADALTSTSRTFALTSFFTLGHTYVDFFTLGCTNVGFLALGRTNVDPNVGSH